MALVLKATVFGTNIAIGAGDGHRAAAYAPVVDERSLLIEWWPRDAH